MTSGYSSKLSFLKLTTISSQPMVYIPIDHYSRPMRSTVCEDTTVVNLSVSKKTDFGFVKNINEMDTSYIIPKEIYNILVLYRYYQYFSLTGIDLEY
jgi:hypothetical protein